MDISGNVGNDLQNQNNPFIFVSLLVFHFEISDKKSKLLHLKNGQLKEVKLPVLILSISIIEDNDKHPQNI